MFDVSINVTFNGNCREAFQFYEKTLGGKINVMMTWGESPMAKDMPADWADKITHASLAIDDREITGGDAPGKFFEKPQGFAILLNLKKVEEAERLFHALSEGGSVRMPLAPTFWAKRFAILTDRFGTPWMLNCTEEQT